MAVAGVVSLPKLSDIESLEKIIVLEKDQHQRLLDIESVLSNFSYSYAFAMKSDIFARKRLSINPSISELKSVLKIRCALLPWMRQWLQCTQYAKEQYQLEAEYLNKALNHLTSILTLQNKKMPGFPLALRDYLSYTQTRLIDSPEKLFYKGALQEPFLFDKCSFGETLKECSVCQRSVHEKESFAEQLQKSIQHSENEVQLIQATIQQRGWIRRGCSALLDFLLWRS